MPVSGDNWVALENLPNMFNFRLLGAGLLSIAAVSMALADFDGPAPLSWRWIQPTTARVSGSPLIDGDTVFVAVGQRAFALDKATGNQKWRFPLVDPIDGYFIGNPVMVGGTLIVSADNRKVYGLDPATGQERWTYVAQQPIVGAAISVGKYVVVSETNSTIMAIDPDTGAPAWKDDATHAESPVAMLHPITGPLVANGDNVLVMDDNNELVCVSTITKKPLWTAPFSTLDINSRPTVVGDLIIVNSGQYVVAVRGSNGRGAWQVPLGANATVGAAVSGDGVFVVDQDGNANFYNLSGRKLTQKPIAIGSYPITRPAVAGKLFVVPTTNGAINLVDPATGQVSWSYLIRPIGVQYLERTGNRQTPGGGVPGGGVPGGQPPPGGQLGNQNQTPERIWTIQASGTPVVAGDTLLVLARDGSLLAFDKNSGVDLTPPSISMSWPHPGDQVNGESLEVLFKIEDEASGVNDKSLKITLDGAPLDVTFGRDDVASVRFSFASKNPPLQNGRRVLSVTASDWMGNTVTKDFVLNVDNSLPKTVTPAPQKQGGLGGPGGKGGGGGGFGGGGGPGR